MKSQHQLAGNPITENFISLLIGGDLSQPTGAQYALNLTAQKYQAMESANEAAIGKKIVALGNSDADLLEALSPGGGYWGVTGGPSGLLDDPIQWPAAAGSWGNFGGLGYDVANFFNQDQTYRILYDMVQAMQAAAVEEYAARFRAYASAMLDGSISLRNIAVDVLSEWTGKARELAMQDLAATIGLGAVISAGMTAVANAAQWHAAKQRAWQHALPPPDAPGWDTSNQAALKLMDEIQQQTVQTNDAIPSRLSSLGLKVPFAGQISSWFNT